MAFQPWRHLGALLFNHRPLHLTLFVTRRCNAHCPFCFYLAGRQENATTREQELSLAEIQRLTDSVGSLLWLAFSGGEPLLRRDLADIATAFYQKNRPAFILLPTNGLRPDLVATTGAAIARRCPRSRVVIKLSIDGPATLHDRLRGVAGAYERTWESFAVLTELERRHANLEIGFNTVLSSATAATLAATRALVRRRAPGRTHTVSLVRGDLARQDFFLTDPKPYRELALSLAAELRRNGGLYTFPGARLKAAQDIIQRRRILKVLEGQKRRWPCVAGRLSTVIDATGTVYPCEDFSQAMGTLRDNGYDLNRILTGPVGRRVKTAIAGRRCTCTHECYHMMNLFFSLRALPGLLHQYVMLLGGRAAAEATSVALRHARIGVAGKDPGCTRARTG